MKFAILCWRWRSRFWEMWRKETRIVHGQKWVNKQDFMTLKCNFLERMNKRMQIKILEYLRISGKMLEWILNSMWTKFVRLSTGMGKVWGLVNTAMDLRVSTNAGNFSASWGDISLWEDNSIYIINILYGCNRVQSDLHKQRPAVLQLVIIGRASWSRLILDCVW
jgi:hypothetical protein